MAAIPDELKCPLCKWLLEDAVMMPCCAVSVCEQCARNKLVRSGRKCPLQDCGASDTSEEDLIPNRRLRSKAQEFVEKNPGVQKRQSDSSSRTPVDSSNEGEQSKEREEDSKKEKVPLITFNNAKVVLSGESAVEELQAPSEGKEEREENMVDAEDISDKKSAIDELPPAEEESETVVETQSKEEKDVVPPTTATGGEDGEQKDAEVNQITSLGKVASVVLPSKEPAESVDKKEGSSEVSNLHRVMIPMEVMAEAKEDPLAAFNKLMHERDKAKGIVDSEQHYGPAPPARHDDESLKFKPGYVHHHVPPPPIHRYPPPGYRPPPNDVQCYNCQGYGHLRRDCPAPTMPRYPPPPHVVNRGGYGRPGERYEDYRPHAGLPPHARHHRSSSPHFRDRGGYEDDREYAPSRFSEEKSRRNRHSRESRSPSSGGKVTEESQHRAREERRSRSRKRSRSRERQQDDRETRKKRKRRSRSRSRSRSTSMSSKEKKKYKKKKKDKKREGRRRRSSRSRSQSPEKVEETGQKEEEEEEEQLARQSDQGHDYLDDNEHDRSLSSLSSAPSISMSSSQAVRDGTEAGGDLDFGAGKFGDQTPPPPGEDLEDAALADPIGAGKSEERHRDAFGGQRPPTLDRPPEETPEIDRPRADESGVREERRSESVDRSAPPRSRSRSRGARRARSRSRSSGRFRPRHRSRHREDSRERRRSGWRERRRSGASRDRWASRRSRRSRSRSRHRRSRSRSRSRSRGESRRRVRRSQSQEMPIRSEQESPTAECKDRPAEEDDRRADKEASPPQEVVQPKFKPLTGSAGDQQSVANENEKDSDSGAFAPKPIKFKNSKIAIKLGGMGQIEPVPKVTDMVRKDRLKKADEKAISSDVCDIAAVPLPNLPSELVSPGALKGGSSSTLKKEIAKTTLAGPDSIQSNFDSAQKPPEPAINTVAVKPESGLSSSIKIKSIGLLGNAEDNIAKQADETLTKKEDIPEVAESATEKVKTEGSKERLSVDKENVGDAGRVKADRLRQKERESFRAKDLSEKLALRKKFEKDLERANRRRTKEKERSPPAERAAEARGRSGAVSSNSRDRRKSGEAARSERRRSRSPRARRRDRSQDRLQPSPGRDARRGFGRSSRARRSPSPPPFVTGANLVVRTPSPPPRLPRPVRRRSRSFSSRSPSPPARVGKKERETVKEDSSKRRTTKKSKKEKKKKKAKKTKKALVKKKGKRKRKASFKKKGEDDDAVDDDDEAESSSSSTSSSSSSSGDESSSSSASSSSEEGGAKKRKKAKRKKKAKKTSKKKELQKLVQQQSKTLLDLLLENHQSSVMQKLKGSEGEESTDLLSAAKMLASLKKKQDERRKSKGKDAGKKTEGNKKTASSSRRIVTTGEKIVKVFGEGDEATTAKREIHDVGQILHESSGQPTSDQADERRRSPGEGGSASRKVTVSRKPSVESALDPLSAGCGSSTIELKINIVNSIVKDEQNEAERGSSRRKRTSKSPTRPSSKTSSSARRRSSPQDADDGRHRHSQPSRSGSRSSLGEDKGGTRRGAGSGDSDSDGRPDSRRGKSPRGRTSTGVGEEEGGVEKLLDPETDRGGGQAEQETV